MLSKYSMAHSLKALYSSGQRLHMRGEICTHEARRSSTAWQAWQELHTQGEERQSSMAEEQP